MYTEQVIHGKYYPHIDGIRTIAVMAVVLYHIFGYLCPGGYVGVDVFFVISGYLITNGILQSLKNKTYSLKDFYTKRIRRIIPAYVLLVFFVLSCSIFLYSSSYLDSILKTVGFSALFSSNVYFYQDAGYFAPNTELNPLLHLWSLAVEEQFYIIIPLILAFVFKVKRKWLLPIIIFILALSLSFSIACNYLVPDQFSSWIGENAFFVKLCNYINSKKSAFNFFMLPTRAWELLAGSLLAYFGIKSSYKSNVSIFAIVGFVLYAVPCLFYSKTTMFPGIGAVPVVIAAMLLLAFGNYGIVGNILRSKPFVGIGKISYSLYLWHWPLIVFWKYITDDSDSFAGQMLILCLSFMMGYLSWRYVEMPIRLKTNWNFKSALRITVTTVTALVLISIVCLKVPAINNLIGASNKYNKEPYWGGNQSNNVDSFNGTYHSDSINVLGNYENIKYVLIGDSHARGLAVGFHEFSKKTGLNGIHMAITVIPALNSFDSSIPSNQKYVEDTFDFLKQCPTCEYVVLSNYWSRRFQGNNLKSLNSTDNQDNETIMSKGLEEFCAKVTQLGRKVIIIDSIPDHPHDVFYYWARSKKLLTGDIQGVNYDQYIQTNKIASDYFTILEKKNLATVVKVYPYFFDSSNVCKVHSNDGSLIYSDSNHLNPSGAKGLIDFIEKKLLHCLQSK